MGRRRRRRRQSETTAHAHGSDESRSPRRIFLIPENHHHFRQCVHPVQSVSQIHIPSFLPGLQSHAVIVYSNQYMYVCMGRPGTTTSRLKFPTRLA